MRKPESNRNERRAAAERFHHSTSYLRQPATVGDFGIESIRDAVNRSGVLGGDGGTFSLTDSGCPNRSTMAAKNELVRE
jgi:hypothetical protein